MSSVEGLASTHASVSARGTIAGRGSDMDMSLVSGSQLCVRAPVGSNTANSDAATNAIATTMFEIEHGHAKPPNSPLLLPLGVDPYFVDPFVEAQCPCILEDMQALLWTLRSFGRKSPAKEADRATYPERRSCPTPFLLKIDPAHET